MNFSKQSLNNAVRTANHPYVRAGVIGGLGMFAGSSLANVGDRLRNRDTAGALTNAALGGASAYAAYNTLLHKKALGNHLATVAKYAKKYF